MNALIGGKIYIPKLPSWEKKIASRPVGSLLISNDTFSRYRLSEHRKKTQRMSKKRVCVVGGGASGILAVAALKDHCDVLCFEQTNDIG